MTYRTVAMGFLMMTLCAVTVWLLPSLDTSHLLPLKNSHIPDAYMNDVTATMMDKNGNISMKITTPKLVHFSDHDETEFDHPSLTLYHQTTEPWLITSNTANTTEGVKEVNFNENVTISHAADLENPNTVIKTNSLKMNIENEIAETKDPITLLQPNITVNATGMRADMSTGNIVLLSQARGEYAPTP